MLQLRSIEGAGFGRKDGQVTVFETVKFRLHDSTACCTMRTGSFSPGIKRQPFTHSIFI